MARLGQKWKWAGLWAFPVPSHIGVGKMKVSNLQRWKKKWFLVLSVTTLFDMLKCFREPKEETLEQRDPVIHEVTRSMSWQDLVRRLKLLVATLFQLPRTKECAKCQNPTYQVIQQNQWNKTQPFITYLYTAQSPIISVIQFCSCVTTLGLQSDDIIIPV